MRPTIAYWRKFPRPSMLIFLGGVFFLFSTTGIATDIMSLGRQTPPRYVLGVLLAGLGATVYAIAGFLLRQRFWKAFFPILIVQIALINLLARSIPNLPYPSTLDAAGIARLQSRLNVDRKSTR